jgi:hypothetical protein
MISYAHDICTQTSAILMQEYQNSTVLVKAFCGPKYFHVYTDGLAIYFFVTGMYRSF